MADSVENPSEPLKLLDVLIVGSGQAGMAAAHRLIQKSASIDLRVVEAAAHVGGRTRNLDVSTNRFDEATAHSVELGGTWVSPSHTALLGLCRDLNIEVFAGNGDAVGADKAGDPIDNKESDQDWPWWYWGSEYNSGECGDGILHTMGGTDLEEHTKTLFRTPETFLGAFDATTLENLKKVGEVIQQESLHQTVPDLSWDRPTPGQGWRTLDGQTTASHLLPLLQTNAGRNVLRNNIHTKNAQEPEQVGCLYNLISFKGCNSDGPDIYRVKGGTQAIPLAIAKTILKPHQLTLGDPVTSVALQPDASYRVATKSGKVFAAKAVLLTGSPPAIQQIQFHPPWPAVQAQLLQRMPMGTTRKCLAIYQTKGPWWRKGGLTGDILATGLPPPLSINGQPLFPECFDTSPFEEDIGVLTCFVEGNANLHFASLTEDKQKEIFKDFLKLSLVDHAPGDDPDAWKPDRIHMYDWSQDPYIRGAYTAYFGPGVLSQPAWWAAYRQTEKAPNLFLAGSDYHAGFGNGYMEGAVRSGQQAADLIWERLLEPQNNNNGGASTT